MHRIYQRLLKEVDGDHKYLRCTYVLYNNFKIQCATISLDKVELMFAETVKENLSENDAGFITYSNYFFLVYGQITLVIL